MSILHKIRTFLLMTGCYCTSKNDIMGQYEKGRYVARGGNRIFLIKRCRHYGMLYYYNLKIDDRRFKISNRKLEIK